jgi:hypothetical protein
MTTGGSGVTIRSDWDANQGPDDTVRGSRYRWGIEYRAIGIGIIRQGNEIIIERQSGLRE